MRQEAVLNRRWFTLGLIAIAQLMVVLDGTIVNIALPSAQVALGFSDSARQWVVTAYALAFGSLLLPGGRIGDLVGRRRAFVVGLVGFGTASLIGGLAPNFDLLIVARALQGASAALLAPAALGLLTTTFTVGAERNRALGVFSAVSGSGAALGLILGGALTQYLDWRWVMIVNVVLAIPMVVAALRLLRHDQTSNGPARLDIPGVITASLGLFALVYGFSSAEVHGWAASSTVGGLVAGIALLAVFVVVEARVSHPLLPLHVVFNRGRGGAYLAVAVVGAGMFGVFLFLTYYMQQTLGFSPLESGLAFLPMVGALMPVAAMAQTRLVPRWGARPLVPLGLFLAAVSMVTFTRLTVHSGYLADVLPGLVLIGVGLGLATAPAFGSATVGVRREEAGVASAMVNTGQQIGGSIGTALLSTVASSASEHYVRAHMAGSGVVEMSAVSGYTTAFVWSAAIFAVGAAAAAVLLPGRAEAARAGEASGVVFAH
jgi:EmrB/QacA subfamily drug resistance transporter